MKKIIKNLIVVIVLLLVFVVAIRAIREDNFNLFTRASVNPSNFAYNPSDVNIDVNDSFSTQVFLLPKQNEVYGYDIVLGYDVNLLQVVGINNLQPNLFKTFRPRVDSKNGKVDIIGLTYNNVPEKPINENLSVVEIKFKVIKAGNTKIRFSWGNNQTNESNISVIDKGEVVDALLVKPNDINVSIGGTEGSTPVATTTNGPGEEMRLIKAELTKLKMYKLTVEVTNSLGRETSLTVYDKDKTREFGKLLYNQRNNNFSRTFNTLYNPTEIVVVSSSGKEISSKVVEK